MTTLEPRAARANAAMLEAGVLFIERKSAPCSAPAVSNSPPASLVASGVFFAR